LSGCVIIIVGLQCYVVTVAVKIVVVELVVVVVVVVELVCERLLIIEILIPHISGFRVVKTINKNSNTKLNQPFFVLRQHNKKQHRKF
jgi:hypothetical protein